MTSIHHTWKHEWVPGCDGLDMNSLIPQQCKRCAVLFDLCRFTTYLEPPTLIFFPIRKSRWEERLSSFLQQYKIAINSIITTPLHWPEEGLADALVTKAAPYRLWIAVEFYGLRFGGKQAATRLQNDAIEEGHRHAKCALGYAFIDPRRFITLRNHAQKLFLIGYLIQEWETLFAKHPIKPLIEQYCKMCRDVAEIVVTYYGWIDTTRFNDLVAQSKHLSEQFGID